MSAGACEPDNKAAQAIAKEGCMRLVVQRVSHASVSVDGKTVGAIQRGVVVLVGVAQARRHISDEDLAGLGGIQLEFGDLEVLTHSAQNRSLGLH